MIRAIFSDLKNVINRTSKKNVQAFNLDAFELLVDPIAAPFDKFRDLRLQDDNVG